MDVEGLGPKGDRLGHMHKTTVFDLISEHALITEHPPFFFFFFLNFLFFVFLLEILSSL